MDSSVTCNTVPLTVVLDMDDTMGQVSAGSIAFQLCLGYTDRVLDKDMFVTSYLLKGGARPWLKQMLQTLAHWKRIGRIGVVAIFTAADNTNGWVTFIKECLELYAETPRLFSRILTRPDLSCVQTPNGMQLVKDLSVFSNNVHNVVLIDDRPENGINGYVIGVPAYTPDVDTTYLKECMKATIPAHMAEIEKVFAGDAEKHPLNHLNFSGDTVLLEVLKTLETMLTGVYPLVETSTNMSNNTATPGTNINLQRVESTEIELSAPFILPR
jgi:hypothetical protein